MRIRTAAVAVAFASSGSAAAGSFSNLYFFGDSLTDSGAFTNLVVASGGAATSNKFTTNPGTVWPQNLGANYGVSVTPGYGLNPLNAQFAPTGGNNYAIGGARVSQQTGVFPSSAAIAANITPLSGQITTNLGQTLGAANPDALYAVWIGANDVLFQTGAVGTGLPLTTAAGNVSTAARDAVAQIARLQAAGARNLVVIGLPDVGATPYAASSGAAATQLLTSLSGAYNDALKQGLVAAGLTHVAYFDPRRLMADILARPASYGITNTSIPACGAAPSLGCGTAQQLPNSSTYLFADGLHPSTTAHKIFSDWVYATLEAPGRAAVPLAVLALGRLGAQWRAIDNRTRDFQTTSSALGRGVFVTADHAPTTMDATSVAGGASGRGNSATVGYDLAYGSMSSGIALGMSDGDFSLQNGGGTIKYAETIVSAFTTARLGDGYIDGILSHAEFDYDTARNVSLGALTTTNAATTKAKQWGLKLGGGYNLKSGNVVHGPVAALSWEQVKVDGYTENSTGFTAMTFGSQTRDSVRHRIGWQLVGDVQTSWARLRPYARLTNEKEYRDNQRTMTAGFAGEPFAFSVPVNASKESYNLFAVGATIIASKDFSLSIGYTSTISQPGARNQSFSVGISAPF